MNNTLKITLCSLAAAVAFTSCYKEPTFEFAEKGPNTSITCDETAVMGGKIDFVADLSDDKYPLSVLNAKLYWDVETGDPVSEVEIRTKETGTYAGYLKVPFEKDIVDGIATVVFTSVNTHLGKTCDTVYVAVNRPVFQALTLSSGDSWRRSLVPVEGKDHEYAYEGAVPSDFQAYIETPAIDGKGTEIKFGWDGTAIVPNGSKPIPFDVVGNGKITFNTKTFVGTPFIDIRVNGVKAGPTPAGTYKAQVALKKGDKIEFSGIENLASWYFEPDHFNVKEDGIYFNAVEGFYTLEMNVEYGFVTVRRVQADGKAATYAAERAITIMGWGIAHPVMTNQLAWDSGSLITLAEVEKGVYQFTGIAVEETDGTTVGGRWRYDYISMKFFGQAGWGAEYGKVTLTDQAKQFLSVPGNIELAADTKLELGATYVMTVTDCTDLDADNKFNCTVDFKKL